jgi:hypothetical protein
MDQVGENARRAAVMVDDLAVGLVAWVVPEPGDLRGVGRLASARTRMPEVVRSSAG